LSARYSKAQVFSAGKIGSTSRYRHFKPNFFAATGRPAHEAELRFNVTTLLFAISRSIMPSSTSAAVFQPQESQSLKRDCVYPTGSVAPRRAASFIARTTFSGS